MRRYEDPRIRKSGDCLSPLLLFRYSRWRSLIRMSVPRGRWTAAAFPTAGPDACIRGLPPRRYPLPPAGFPAELDFRILIYVGRRLRQGTGISPHQWRQEMIVRNIHWCGLNSAAYKNTPWSRAQEDCSEEQPSRNPGYPRRNPHACRERESMGCSVEKTNRYINSVD